MNEEDLIAAVRAYAAKYRLTLIERLGFGIHGIVYVTESNALPGNRALKVHHDADCYLREREIYQRLQAHNIVSVFGFKIPQLERFDDALMAFEMTIVRPPFLLDFAGAYLDAPPEFSAEVWEEWEEEKSEQFGDRWESVQLALARLQNYGIYMIDPSPKNIRFE